MKKNTRKTSKSSLHNSRFSWNISFNFCDAFGYKIKNVTDKRKKYVTYKIVSSEDLEGNFYWKEGGLICKKRKRVGASLATSPNIIRISKMRRCCQWKWATPKEICVSNNFRVFFSSIIPCCKEWFIMLKYRQERVVPMYR